MINKITPDDLDKHAKWLRGEEGGVRIVTEWLANLSDADLSDADLRGANLRGADLSDADLSDADLRGANLRGANLRGADLSRADLSRADLRRADLYGADLSSANLSDADLSDADLSSANLSGADLSRADLSDADLRGAKNIPDYVYAVTQIVPEGDLIVYKKLRDGKIAKLLIPKEAKRSNATGRKCRAEYAKVLAIESVNGKEALEEGASKYCSNFVYKVGETVRPDKWDENRWNECSSGIHFFLTRFEAVNY